MDRLEIRERYWLPLAAFHKAGAWEALDAAYGDPRRAYHSWSHISDLLQALDEVPQLLTRRDLVTTAIFWHDAVYTTRDETQKRRADIDNVHDSARLFRDYSLFGATDTSAVFELVMATADHLESKASRERYPGFSDDLDLLLDLDLSTLAAPWERFSANFRAIRFEFSWVPEPVFNAGQGGFLASLLANEDKLFRRAEPIRRWRAPAIGNIVRCLEELKRDGEALSPGGTVTPDVREPGRMIQPNP
jgi:predicted metal-dependent HD superfamily phosphohydrolase